MAGGSVETKEKYEYSIIFAHRDIDSGQQIRVYGATGDLILVVSPGDGLMSYEEGRYKVPVDYVLRARKAYLEFDIDADETELSLLMPGYYSNREIQGITGSSMTKNLVLKVGEIIIIKNERMTVESVTIQTLQDYQREQQELTDETIVDGVRRDGDIRSFPSGFGVRMIVTVARGADGTGQEAHGSSFKSGEYLVQYRESSTSKTSFSTQQEDIMQISNASYFVQHSWDRLIIDYKAREVWIKTSIFSRSRKDKVTMTFDYVDKIIPFSNVAKLRDGSYSTAAQLIFFSQPVPGIPLFTVDLGSSQAIDAIDIIAGFFSPDDRGVQKLNCSNWYTLKYSTTGIEPDDFFLVSRKSTNFNLRGGESFSVEGNDLGEAFQARYLQLILENAQKIEYKDGLWAVSIAEFAVYQDLILKGEAVLTDDLLLVDSSTLYDYVGLLEKVGDRLYKVVQVEEGLDEQWKVDARALNFLREFQKNHTKIRADVEYDPWLQIGHTLTVVDERNGVNRNYFVGGIRNNGGRLNVDLAYYPGG